MTVSSQIFKQPVPDNILLHFLDTNAMKLEKDSFIVNTDTYKKATFNGSLSTFINDCKPYYHNSKLKYVERKMTYNGLTTILRQICKLKNITYKSSIKYIKSDYTISYTILFNKDYSDSSHPEEEST